MRKKTRKLQLNLEGKKFGRLTAIKRVYPPKGKEDQHGSFWLCECSCGNMTTVISTSLTRVRSTHSCGCIALESIKAIATRHGGSGLNEYRIYKGMKYRCYNKENKDYSNYGARGIKMADSWLGNDGFINFLTDMGPRPEGTSIERKDVNGDYSPENCIWGDAFTQSRNRRKFVCLTNYTDNELIAEYERRFPVPEYGLEAC